MKILQVCSRYYPDIGGVEEHVKNISERLAKKYDLWVYTTDPSGKLPKEEDINGVKVRRFKSWAPNEAYYFSRELEKYLIKNSDSFDIVHAHSYSAFPGFYAAQAKGRNKLVFTPHYHGRGHTFFRNLLHKPYRFLGRKIFEKSDNIICVSNYEKNLVMHHFKLDDEKVTVIPNGINLKEFNLEKIKKDYLSILSVSRLEKYKGIQYLIKCLPELPHMVLDIVGKGPYKKSLVKIVRKLGVEDRVKFYENLPRHELLQKYADADLFVLLSKYEAYGICVLEALVSRTPCIVANASVLKEWINNENCFGVDYPLKIDVLTELIKNVVGKKVDKIEPLSWDEVVERLERVYTP